MNTYLLDKQTAKLISQTRRAQHQIDAMKTKLKVEVNQNAVKENGNFSVGNGNLVMVTPEIDEDYWLMRVPLSDKQAVVCFPKFFTIGCGFQREKDWNTNLPLSCDTDEIFNHIKHNKGDKRIKNEDVKGAIDLLRKKAIEVGALKP